MIAMGIWTVDGQDRAVATLQRALASGRLASTWIFHGPTGVGKYRTALGFAKSQLCYAPKRQPNGTPPTLAHLPAEFILTEPCGSCPSCLACDSQVHPDMHIVNRQLTSVYDRSGKSRRTTLSMDVIRGEIIGDDSPDHRVESKLYKHSQLGRGKWFIIDEADLMQGAAQNALLKALEEPPPLTFIVMCTSSLSGMISTIRSRSQLVAFGPLPTTMIVASLTQSGFAPADAGLLARLSDNSLGVIESWRAAPPKPTARRKGAEAAGGGSEPESRTGRGSGSGPAAWVKQLAQAMDQLQLGRASATDLVQVIGEVAEQIAAVRLSHDAQGSKDRATRDGAILCLDFLAAWFSDRLRSYVGAAMDFPLPSTSSAMVFPQVQACMEICSDAAHQIDSNVHQATALTHACIALEAVFRGG